MVTCDVILLDWIGLDRIGFVTTKPNFIIVIVMEEVVVATGYVFLGCCCLRLLIVLPS